MQGMHHVLIQDKRVRYEFTIRRNITIIRGDSATGKTVLIELLSAYGRSGSESGVDVRCDKPCVVLTRERWEQTLSTIRDSIVFIDEGNPFVSSHDFSRAISGTDNYYVLVSREALPNLPYSVNEIYGIRSSGKYAGIKQTYHELYHIYADSFNMDNGVRPDKPEIVTEDSNAGYEFFAGLCGDRLTCVSAQGKSKIAALLSDRKDEKTLVIGDGAAFGSEMEKLIRLINEGAEILLFLPESFEWLILSSDLLIDPEVNGILESPEDHIASEKYMSWEQFFTDLLIQKSQNSYLKYNKRKLNPAYLQEREKKAIIDALPVRIRGILDL